MKYFSIEADIRKAFTLPAEFYSDPAIFEKSKEKLFGTTWQYVADNTVVSEKQNVYPFSFQEGLFDEPLLISRNKTGEVHCLSNVCTHRGKIIIEQANDLRMLTCGYHGRCFDLDGQMTRMPQFKDAENFPSQADHLTKIALEEWLGMYFISLNPAIPFDEMIKPIMDRVGWMPFETMKFVEKGSAIYQTSAHWALYCDNFLEGFHIPFVHPGLNEAIVFEEYQYELFPWCNLQLGIAKAGEPSFKIPISHIDYGKNVYAYYFWLFPNLMLNFYPWGLSMNVVQPLGPAQTRIVFRSYVFENTEFSINKDQLDLTEMEDESVVESVQKGIRSRFYNKGRFSPTMEQGVHHFHRLIAEFL